MAAFADFINAAVFTVTSEGIITGWSPVAERTYGYRAEEVLGRAITSLFSAGGTDEIRRIQEHLTSGDQITNYPVVALGKDGSSMDVSLSLFPIIESEQGVVSALVVTNRSANQGAARGSVPDAMTSAILDCALDAVITIDHRGAILEFNRAAEELFGFTREHVIGKQMAELIIPPALREDHYRGLERFLTEGTERILGRRLELSAIKADGTEFPVELSINKVRIGGPPIFTGYVRDLTERKAAETATRQLIAIVESSDDAILSTDVIGTVLTWNPGAERMYGFTADEMIGGNLSALYPPEKLDELPTLIDRLKRGESIREYETVRLRRDGSRFNVAMTLSPISDESGEVVAFSSVVRDNSERTRAQEKLRRSEENYRLLFEGHPAPMWVYDLGTLRFLEVNKAAIATYGFSREQFLLMTIEDIRPAEDVAALHEAINDPHRGRVEAGTWRHRKKDGTVIDVSVVSHAVEFDGRGARLVLATDVTEQRRLEEQLRQSQKMEAIGSLAGGIAHDFNNILTAIKGYSELLIREVKDEHLRDWLRELDKAAESAAQLTKQLLAFSRQQVLHPRVVELNAVVSENLKLLERVIGEDVELVSELKSSAGQVFVDPTQLARVILNLAVNAREAMPDGGKLTIRTNKVELDEDYAVTLMDVEPGVYAVIEVTDTGTGIDEARQAKIFEPFFTTKPGGTGLGLATVYGIVKQSGGHIWLYSEEGIGTTFKTYLPSTHAPSLDQGSVEDIQSLTGNETVLVVEDSEPLRALVTRVVGSFGYNVLVAASAMEAIRLVKESDIPIDLMLTDVVMPGMNGRELAEKLQSEYPSIKVLFTSGYPADTVLRQGISEDRVAFIEKPFMPRELARKIRETLESPEAPD